ncbi:sugar phosphate isomerase/epimerase family protein [Prosthecobacter dejongeii]|uniref:Sugar phosphate isomerase/epimerase n=1 Tax=Prosthecobacter dejongeii TaxID=48465 RepID=A0A7W8DPN0_9BACT|nr:sugar phosphate isomerase/epimerase family protein [Prosthecobacter dejongeii]MBB5037623.1 sugar phosphate isomerase/epimerase [Prosthecobacter dejongeii]
MKKFLLPLLLLAVAGFAATIPETAKVGQFYAGCQAYSFRLFSVMEAIEKTAAAGGKTIEFYPKQKLSPEKPDQVFNHESPPEVIEAVKAKLAEQGVTAVGYGVIKLGADAAADRKVFEFCKTMGIGIVITEPDVKGLDGIEALVKEFDIKMAIHNHPKRPLDRAYLFWDPNYVLELVKDRDPRMGACADVGHWVRSGLNPVDCIRILKGRIFDSHMKDLTEFGNPKAHDLPFGTGKSDIPAILAEYHAQGYPGPLHVEYEHNWETSLPEIKQSLEFVKNWKPAAK